MLRSGMPWRLVGLWICHSRMTTRGSEEDRDEHDHNGIIETDWNENRSKIVGKKSNNFNKFNSYCFYQCCQKEILTDFSYTLTSMAKVRESQAPQS